MTGRLLSAVSGILALFAIGLAGPAAAETVHGLSTFGNLKYGPDFTHFEYANPDAPKGGEITLSAPGTFDSLNPFIVKGTAPGAVGLIYDQLMSRSNDEPTAAYGLIAESAEVPADKSWVIFNLRPEARWHDGEPITADDVVFSYHALVEKGAPVFRFYYHNVVKAEALGPHKVKFTFDQANNSELPGIMGELYVLPKHFWEGKDFTAANLDVPLGSGPYKVGKVDPGRSITMERVKDYWGKDLPVNKGFYNFDRMRYDFYRDQTVAFEAFKASAFDLHVETTSRRWATGYDFPAAKSGAVVKEMIRDETPEGTQFFAFNLRNPKFQNRLVREAFNLAFDFDWLNDNLFYNFYERSASYWPRSELGASGLPSKAELALLEPYRDQLPPEVFTKEFKQPTTEPPSSLRANLRKAAQLLKQAGWEVRDGVLTNVKTGEKMEVEFVTSQPSLDRIINPYIRNLERLGIKMTLRVVDSSQMQDIMDNYDFEMTSSTYFFSSSPGNEQREYWGSASADAQGGRNIMGIKNPVVDALIEKIIFAQSREAQVTATHALDRVLLWNYYSVLHYFSDGTPVAYWNKFSRPKIDPKYGLTLSTWWVDPDKLKAIRAEGYKGE